MILLNQFARADDSDEFNLLVDAQLLCLPLQIGFQLSIVIHQPKADAPSLAQRLDRLEQDVDPFQVDQLADVQDVIAGLVTALLEAGLRAKHVGGNPVGMVCTLAGSVTPAK